MVVARAAAVAAGAARSHRWSARQQEGANNNPSNDAEPTLTQAQLLQRQRTRERLAAATQREPKLFEPAVPYGQWDANWDGLQRLQRQNTHREAMRNKPHRPPTRHVILIRHGQYDETHKEDRLRRLTPLGEEQARRTGERLRDMLRSSKNVRLRCSTMTRAQETCDIILPYLPARTVVEPADPNLAEGRPAHAIPGRPFDEALVAKDGARIEAAFKSLFYRATDPLPYDDDQHVDHEWHVVVCHGNVIRYMAMRALQLPPEAWLRLCTFNCSLTYFIVRPSGSVSLRTLGDIGHLQTNLVTFSNHHAFEW